MINQKYPEPEWHGRGPEYYSYGEEPEEEDKEVVHAIESGMVEVYKRYPTKYEATFEGVSDVYEYNDEFVVCYGNGEQKTFNSSEYMWLEVEP